MKKSDNNSVIKNENNEIGKSTVCMKNMFLTILIITIILGVLFTLFFVFHFYQYFHLVWLEDVLLISLFFCIIGDTISGMLLWYQSRKVLRLLKEDSYEDK